MAYPYTLTYGTVSAGDAILAAHHNTTHQEHIDSNIPENIDDYSVSAAEMRTTADPYPGSTESLATTLAGEIERLRYVLKQITGGTYWYTDPVGLDSTIVSSSLTSVGTIGTGVWQGTSIGTSYTDAKVTSVSGSTGAVTDGDIDHDSLANFASNEHYTQANITATGTVASGTWQGTAIDGTYIDLEGTEVKSTGEGGGTKYLREDGDGTCSWQAVTGGVTSVSGSTGVVADGDIDHDQLANFASNEHYTQANITATGTIASGTWNGTSIGTAYTDAKVTSVSGSTGAVADGDIDHDQLANFASNEHFTQANITATGTIASGTWNGTAIDGAYVDIEGTEVKSTGESGGTKYLREDGDNSCSWQAPASVGKHTLWIPAAAMRPTNSNGCASITDVETTSGRPDLQVLDFDTSADEHAQFQIAMPKSWNESTITFRAFWTSTATDTDGVAWGLQGVATANDDTVNVAYGTAVVVTDDNISAAEDCLVTAESSAVTIAGSPSTDELCFFRIFRDVSDANDDMAEDARLIGIQMFITTDAGEDT